MKRVADNRGLLIKLSGLNIVYCFLLQRNLLAFIQQSNVMLPKALQDLSEDPANPVLLARVVGLLVGGMAARTGHRRCIFWGMTAGNVKMAEAYKGNFTIKVSISNVANECIQSSCNLYGKICLF